MKVVHCKKLNDSPGAFVQFVEDHHSPVNQKHNYNEVTVICCSITRGIKGQREQLCH